MGMDVYGKDPTSKEGEYFRASVWSWRPLAGYLCEQFPEITEGCMYWQSNDGDGLDSAGAHALGVALEAAIETGEVAKFFEGRQSVMDALPDEQCKHCHGTGKRTDMEVANGCNGCKGSGTVRPISTWYSIAVDHVSEFAAFCKACGGFEIC